MYGFVRVGAITPQVKVADTKFNGKRIIEEIKKAYDNKVQLAVFPELAITGYTCGDLFLQSTLIKGAKYELKNIIESTRNLDIVCAVGLPYAINGNLYNMAAVFKSGELLALVPKTSIPNYNEFYEKRYFAEAFKGVKTEYFYGEEVIVGTNIIFKNLENDNYTFSVEICEDLWSVIPPSSYHTMAGANIVCNLSASNEVVSKGEYRKGLVKNQSARTISAYVFSSCGYGESTTDLVFSAHNLIYENNNLIKESKIFENESIYADIDTDLITNERIRNTNFQINDDGYSYVYFTQKNRIDGLEREINPTPFIPENIDKRCNDVIEIQAIGLMKRLEHIGTKTVLLGVSGGLDSTQALIVCVRAFEKLSYDKRNIIAVTMPCFGTSRRTYNNAKALCDLLGVTLKEISIKESVLKHFEDIGQEKDKYDLTFENAQARERTQVLMDLANKLNGIVVGTGDLSELALGFATYNGDHMSMYGVNASVPKTLLRYTINYYGDNCGNDKLREILYDVTQTPVSPELLPPDENDNINQVTENIVGPYELHDFFLYNMVRYMYGPKKIIYLCKKAFNDKYSEEEITKWLKLFYKRFFSQQYKRSCIPDGPKVGSITLSPRGDFKMPSDAQVNLWLDEIK